MKQVILFCRLTWYRAFPFSLVLLLLLLCALSGCSGQSGPDESALDKDAQKEEKNKNNEEVKRDFFAKDTKISRQALPLPRGFSAHRGRLLGHSHPDNSRAAITQVVRAKVPYLELDLRRAFDGEIYLYHDRRIGVDGARVPFATVMGDWLRSHYPDVLSMNEAFRILCKEEKGEGSLGIFAQLDMKAPESEISEMIEEIISLASRIDRETCSITDSNSRSNVTSQRNNKFNGNEYLPAKQLGPTLASKLIFQCQEMTCAKYLAGHKSNAMWLARLHSEDDLPELLRLKPEIIQINFALATDDLIKRIQQTGALVLVKALGVNDNQKTWEMLRKKGVDIILTDLGA